MDQKLNHLNHDVAVKILTALRDSSDWKPMWELADQLRLIFPNSISILDEAEIAAFHNQEYHEMNRIINDMLDLHPTKEVVDRIMHNKLFCINHMMVAKDQISKQPLIPDIRRISNSPFTIVFQGSTVNTISSFFHACTDVVLASTINYIYDPSNTSEVETMLRLPQHITSLPVKDLGTMTPYTLWIKGDWTFLDEMDYITILRTILDSDSSHGQVILSATNNNDPREGEEVKYERRKIFVSHGQPLNLDTPTMIAHHAMREMSSRFPLCYSSVRLAGAQVVKH